MDNFFSMMRAEPVLGFFLMVLLVGVVAGIGSAVHDITQAPEAKAIEACRSACGLGNMLSYDTINGCRCKP